MRARTTCCRAWAEIIESPGPDIFSEFQQYPTCSACNLPARLGFYSKSEVVAGDVVEFDSELIVHRDTKNPGMVLAVSKIDNRVFSVSVECGGNGESWVRIDNVISREACDE